MAIKFSRCDDDSDMPGGNRSRLSFIIKSPERGILQHRV